MLFMKDATYLVLMQEAAKQGKSFGKYVNEVLNKAAEEVKGGMAQQAICIVCGRPAAEVGFGAGQQCLYVCTSHKTRLDGLSGRRTVKSEE